MYSQKPVFVYPEGSFWAGYTPFERKRFLFHTVIAIACLPLYYLFPFKFGLFVSPYLFFLAVRPKNEYLFPIVIHMLYGTQQRYFFMLGCFIYVLLHCMELRRYALGWVYGLYMLALPYFLWFLWQKMQMPRFGSGIAENFGGLMTHFVFAPAFWGALVVKKTGRPFFRGMLAVSVGLLLAMSLLGGGASLDRGDGMGAERTVFSYLFFFAVAWIPSAFVFVMRQKVRGYAVEKFLCYVGILLIVFGFFHVLRFSLSFTGVGLGIFSAFLAWISGWHKVKTVLLILLPMCFALSAMFVLASEDFVYKYGSLYADEGAYNEMKVDSVDGVLKKLQRKSVDDRAAIWAHTINYIKNEILPSPIWVKPAPYMTMDMYTDGGRRYTVYLAVHSHNVMLNMIRYYGFYGGLALYVVYIWFVCKKETRGAFRELKQRPSVVVLATCIAEFIIGGHTGGYPLQPSVGIALFACLGACWGEMRDLHRRMRQVRFVSPFEPWRPELPHMRRFGRGATL